MALLPPLLFDETLYHLPFVRSVAASGQLQFLTDNRFPVFPRLQELLCVPLFVFAGDVATHLVSLAEVAITAAILFEWGDRDDIGLLAAALFAGSPIVVLLATIGYVDAALALFVTAGFYCADRRRPLLAGLFFGTACSVKYLGGFFAVAALVVIAFRSRKEAVAFAAACLAAALPTTLWLAASSGNPLFPFFGATPWPLTFPHVPFAERLVRTLQLAWNVTFARERVNQQPPFTPFLILMLVVLIVASLRNARARSVAIIAAAYVVAFSFLPQDSRYLVPLLPLISIVTATAIPSRPAWLAPIAVAPGFLYAVYALAVRGLPPPTAAEREAMLTRRIPEYAAVVRAGTETIYVCGGERLKYYARGTLLGDFSGPYSYDRVLSGARTTSAIATNLRRIDVRYFLVAKRVCPPPNPDGGMDLVYEDAAAQLWRVR